MQVFLLRNKEGRYYDGHRDYHSHMCATGYEHEAHICTSISEATVLAWESKEWAILPYTFGEDTELLQMARELRVLAIQCGKEVTQNDCLIAIVKAKATRMQFPELIADMR